MMDMYEENNSNLNAKQPTLWCQGLLKSIKIRILLVIIVGLVVGLATPSLLDVYLWDKDKFSRPECQLPPAFRLNALTRFGSIDKWKEEDLQKKCFQEKGCNMTLEGEDVPACYHPHPSNYYYKVQEVKRCDEKKNLDLSVYAKMEEAVQTFRTNPIKNLRMRVDEMDDHHVVVRIFNARSISDFTPYDYLDYRGRKRNGTRCNRPERLYDIGHLPEVGGRLFINIKRKDGTSIFNTNFGPLIAEAQYLEVTTVLPSGDVYGLGQGRHTTLRHNMKKTTTWTLFAGQDDSWGHGVHPFYLCMEQDGRAHGVLLEHSNALEVTLHAVPSITYKSIGSSFLFHILMGPRPEDVVRQLTDLVGRPQMPPYWALGHHVCRTSDKAEETVNELREKKIPQESDCFSDLLALQASTINSTRITEFAQNISSGSQKLLLVQVPHVLKSDAQDKTKFVWQNDRTENAVGKLSQEEVVYPDYFQNLNEWTSARLQTVLESLNVSVDGYLLSNNTPVSERVSEKCSNTSLNDPTFLKGKKDLWNKTLCMETCHGKSSCSRLSDKNHYNLHNLYGYKYTKAMFEAVHQQKEFENTRPFIASLSTFTGSGRYGGQFSIGFNASWEDMKIAMVQTQEFSLYGIPMTGAPVCGYHYRRDRDLCSSWTKLGAFQPFLISYHYSNKNEDENVLTPILMDDFVGSIAAASFQLRYSLLPYLYTLFYEASTNGTLVLRPLFFEFPTDLVTRGIDEQFLWGSALMMSTPASNSTRQYSAYFPAGIWYDFHTGSIVHQGQQGVHKNLTVIEYYLNIHVRGGNIIATHKQGLYTEDIRKAPYRLRVALSLVTEFDAHASASGQIYIDDGISKDGPSLLVEMEVAKGNLTLKPNFLKGKKETDFGNFPYSLSVESIFVFGLTSSMTDYRCMVNGVSHHNCFRNEDHGTVTFRNLTTVSLLKHNRFTWQ